MSTCYGGHMANNNKIAVLIKLRLCLEQDEPLNKLLDIYIKANKLAETNPDFHKEVSDVQHFIESNMS